MDLKDLLQLRLGIDEGEADSIVDVVEEWKEKHHHHHEHNKQEDIYSQILESKEQIEKDNYDLTNIHCNGCGNNCTLDEPGCNRGINIQGEILKLKNE